MFDANSFDEAAESYDLEFTESNIGKLQRERVWIHFSKLLATKEKPLSILEINCGTGEDAFLLARMGHKVIASDASAKMITIANNKIKQSLFAKSLTFQQCAFKDLKHQFQGQQFDVIFSDFGGLNCVSTDELKQLSYDFKTLLNPDGMLVLVIMGTNCLWEQFYFSIKGNSKEKSRRKQKNGVETIIKSSKFTTWYFSPMDIKTILQNDFDHQATKPIGLFLPPSYLEPFFKTKPTLLSALNGLEKLTGNIESLSNFADHFYIQFNRMP